MPSLFVIKIIQWWVFFHMMPIILISQTSNHCNDTKSVEYFEYISTKCSTHGWKFWILYQFLLIQIFRVQQSPINNFFWSIFNSSTSEVITLTEWAHFLLYSNVLDLLQFFLVEGGISRFLITAVCYPTQIATNYMVTENYQVFSFYPVVLAFLYCCFWQYAVNHPKIQK